MRQIVVDTETTGLEIEDGHRILELGCVEIIDRKLTRRHFHHYINPQREIDDGALQVHGITREFLSDKPCFADIWPDFLEFIKDAELVIHNAEFDIRFLNYELGLIGASLGEITRYCSVVDSLAIARNKHPGQKNTLDALCKRYNVDNSQRELHGALLDAEILADVYLLLTGGQVALGLGDRETAESGGGATIRRLPASRPRLRVVRASVEESAQHEAKLDRIEQASGARTIWRQLELAEA